MSFLGVYGYAKIYLYSSDVLYADKKIYGLKLSILRRLDGPQITDQIYL